MSGIAAPDKAGTSRTRLHITPFNAELIDRYIPPSVRPLATNISYHTVQTAPEKGYGYVELPSLEAEKLKKKLNGMTLKGSKVRIEEARPEKKRKADAEAEEESVATKKVKKVRKEKAKREEGVLPGYELEQGRHVKRGWEEKEDRKAAKKAKKNASSADGLDGKAMLFKTSVPANAVPIVAKTKTQGKTKDEKALKEAKPEKTEPADKPTKKKVVVGEFSKSRKPAPSAVGGSRDADDRRYEDGKGWVDRDGVVMEPETASMKRKREQSATTRDAPTTRSKSSKQPVQHKEPVNPEEQDSESLSGNDSEDSSVLSSSSEDEAGEDVDMADAQATPTKLTTDEEVKSIHPLEALYKRPAVVTDSASKPRPTPIDTSFSFFDPDADVEVDEAVTVPDATLPPQTPHTQRDLEWRGMRSAAPTPETAAIGKKFQFPSAAGGIDEDEDVEGGDSEDVTILAAAAQSPTVVKAASGIAAAEGEQPESEFRKWFYDNRGDLNRSWKKRRREERKSKRQRENRRLSRKVA